MHPLQIRPSLPGDGQEQLRGLLAAGHRALDVDGDLASARRYFEAAAREAEAQEDPESLAQAAIGLGGMWLHEHRDPVALARVRAWRTKALEKLEPDTSLAIRLRVRDAAETGYPTGSTDGILAALEVARRAGDPVVLAEALSVTEHGLLGPAHSALRLALADELVDAAAATGQLNDAVLGLLWRAVSLYLAGHPHADRARAQLRTTVDASEHLAIAFVATAIDVMTLIRAGRLDEAERMADQCAERGTAAGDPDAPAWHAAQIGTIRWYQGRAAELLPMLRDLAVSPTLSEPNDSFLAALAVAAASAGDTWEASAALRRLRRPTLEALPPSSVWLVSLFAAVEAAHLLGDADTAREAYVLLEPFADLPVMASLAITCFGSAHHPLAVAAETFGDLDLAIDHLRRALAADEAIGNRPAHLTSRAALAAALARRSQAGDREAFAEMLPDIERDAERLGMAPWHAHRGLGREPDGALTMPASIVRVGRGWRLTVNGRTVVVADSVGMGYLKTLLARPGEEVPATELASGSGVGEARVDDAAQFVLDDSAKAEYRRRIEELRRDIDEADANADIERAAQLRAEYDWLVEELERTTGLHGRARQFTTNSDRARTAVRKAIRRALDAIGRQDPELQRDLEASILTGSRCSYRARVGRR